MIKVIVVVSGLALAELTDGGFSGATTVISFPTTMEFRVSGFKDVPKFPDEFDSHAIMASAGKTLLAAPFDLTVEVPESTYEEDNVVKYAKNNMDDAIRFANLRTLHGPNGTMLRTKCTAADKLADCKAKNKNGNSVKLLDARVRLKGTWTLTAAYADKAISRSMAGAPLVRFRSAALDPSDSALHVLPSRHLANTLIFSAPIQDLATDLKLTKADGTPIPVEKTDAARCIEYDPTAPQCVVIELMNHRTSCPESGCPEPPWAALDHADAHFLQLYRLLKSYDSGKDSSTLRGWMPALVLDGSATAVSGALGPATGGTSVRCYPGVLH